MPVKTMMDGRAQEREGERGNVLFLILIAVALFAALSYAVTQSTRSGAGTSDNETSLINSAQLTQYPAGLRTAVVRMIIGGTDVNNLEFNGPSQFSSLTSPAWGVFEPSGGGATYSQAPADIMAGGTPGTWVFNGENQIHLVGSSTGTATPDATSVDVIAFLPGISLSVCQKINSELGLPDGTPNPIPTESGIDYATQMTDASQGLCNGGCGATIGLDAGSVELEGQPFGCFQDGSLYVYYHVLVER